MKWQDLTNDDKALLIMEMDAFRKANTYPDVYAKLIHEINNAIEDCVKQHEGKNGQPKAIYLPPLKLLQLQLPVGQKFYYWYTGAIEIKVANGFMVNGEFNYHPFVFVEWGE